MAAVDYVAGLVKVDPALFGKYAWHGSTIEYHRAQIRKAQGPAPCRTYLAVLSNRQVDIIHVTTL